MLDTNNYYKFWSLSFVTRHPLWFFVDQFLLFNEVAKHAHFFVAIFDKIESINSTRPQLQQVIVEALFADADHGGRVLERVALQLHPAGLVRIWHHDAVVELTPYHYFFYYLADRPLLCTDYLSSRIWSTIICRLTIFLAANSTNLGLHQALLLEILQPAELRLRLLDLWLLHLGCLVASSETSDGIFALLGVADNFDCLFGLLRTSLVICILLTFKLVNLVLKA